MNYIDDIYSRFPIIDFHEDFILRQPTILQEDCLSIKEIYTDPLVIKFVPDDCIPHTDEDMKEEARYYANCYLFKKSIYWFIAEKSTNKAVGTCGFPSWDRHNQKAELSYNIIGKYHNRGIMTKAIGMALKYAFEVMKVVRIDSQLDQTNIASIRVLEKNGMTKDGILPKYRRYKNNSHVDVLMMSITDDVYFGLKNKKNI
ncbi:GNAT family N-acetyltransferase [Candidatus Deianiraea vastatrix]|uniref:Ribosomal-protein-alanine acetyltransferase n=1 Tax=Candidatus Deianiraea vastatrix TaxID=2163644 RepID=A0A5B8XGE1_9RICK|nr:GNAT family N-acetyltransferase [Candidatus Deianiraea vastatrix]QED23374.1 Putative ribosomal-protein-alanine acetyltransferase [Candidatus Deianiraea vastatrix]